MSSLTPTADPLAAKFEIYSVHFDFPGGQAIKLRDPTTDRIIGTNPEWITGVRNELAAYVRGTQPEIRVVFAGKPEADGNHTVGADGTPLQVLEKQVVLTFDARTGLSNEVVFIANVNLPDQIGLHSAKLDWYCRIISTQEHCLPAGTSTHRIATVWRAFANPPASERGLPGWAYLPLVEWTCEWAAGLSDEKAICDAIIANVGASGLRYGQYAADVRELLLNKGGMCGVWYQAFQHMAHCQGVFVYRRRFLVDWRRVTNGEEQWCAIVIRSGGLNQAHPTPYATDFHDNDTIFPVPAGTVVPISNRTERRYRFWGSPGYRDDGHCINFLIYDGHLYLYDACFAAGPILIDAPLPINNTNVAQGGANLAPFKAAYFDGAIDYMLGSIYNGPDFLRSVYNGANGMTVKTPRIPENVNGMDGLTFRWGN